MRSVIVVIALLASEFAFATPVPRPRPQAAPVSAAGNRISAASISQAHVTIPLPRMRPSKVGAEISPSHEPKQAEADTLRVASAVPMPYQRPSNAGVRNEGVSIVPKTVPVAPVKQVEPKQPEPPAAAKLAPPLVETPAAETPAAETPAAVATRPDVVKLPEAPSVETRSVETGSSEAEPVETKPADAQFAEPEPAAPQSAEAKAAEALAIEAEAGAHAGAPPRQPGLASKTFHAVKQFLTPHKTEKSLANEGTQGAQGTQQSSEPADSTEPNVVASAPAVAEAVANAPAPAAEPPVTSAPSVAAAAPDTSAPAHVARPEMRPFTLPPDAAIEPLKSNGPAIEAAKPAETTAEEQSVQVAQLSIAASTIAQAMKKIPAPRKRPLSAWPRPDDLVMRDVTAPTPEGECDAAMNSGILVAQRLQRLGHRGSCMVPYALRLDAIMVGRKRVDLVPPAQLRCGFALAVANWVRAEADPAADSLGSQLVGIRQLDSYNCRTMSSTKRLMSEHSMGNALDVAEFIFANHQHAHLTNPATQKAMRYRLRSTACKRFKTVLGPGVPQHHDHIHIDLRHHFGPGGICHWNVL